jgi:hypothetical protein
MRMLAILCIAAAALTSSIAANTEGAQGGKGKGAKAQDIGAIRNNCMAEAYGYGVNKSAQVRACVQRAKAAK